MDQSFYFSPVPQKSNKKLIISAIAVLGLLGALATIAITRPPHPMMHSFELDESEFREYMRVYSKKYSSEEEYQARFRIFMDNLALVRIHNQAKHDWLLGVNEFADLSMDEFKGIYLKYKPSHKRNPHSKPIDVPDSLPDSVNWVTAGAVTPVKNQGQCGSCWAFSTTGSIEGAWQISGHSLVSLSEQQLVDCSTAQGNQGCNGGLMDDAFQYVITNGGITTESNYPYLARDGTCNTSKASQVAAKISSYQDVAPSSSTALLTAIVQQPVSVAVEADQLVWQLYFGGVVTRNCGTNLDHGVLAAGYNMGGTNPYYLVKNSWGSGWGQAGYIMIGIVDGDGVCGIQMQPSYPVV